MKEWLLENIFTIIATIFGSGSAIGWILEKRKRNIDLKIQSTDALSRMQEVYDKFTEDYHKKIAELLKEIEDLKKEIFRLKQLLNEESNKNKNKISEDE